MGPLDQRILDVAPAIVRELVKQIEELPDGIYSVREWQVSGNPRISGLRALKVRDISFTEVLCHEDSSRVIIAHLEKLPEHFRVQNGRIVG